MGNASGSVPRWFRSLVEGKTEVGTEGVGDTPREDVYASEMEMWSWWVERLRWFIDSFGTP